MREGCESGMGDALIVNTTVFCYSYHSFHCGSGSFKFSLPGLHKTKPDSITSVCLMLIWDVVAVQYSIFFYSTLHIFLNQ